MKPLQLALKYMDIFYGEKDPSLLKDIFHKDLIFDGPFYKFHSAKDYIDSLLEAPPKDMSFEIIESFENETSACLVYNFSKGEIKSKMSQLFKVKNEKISEIILIFDSKDFS